MAVRDRSISINRHNVGRIAERIASNELEARGFRVSDLNRDGLSANADLLAARHGKVWQVQVKGSTNDHEGEPWWIQYGYCTDAIMDKREPMFNRQSSFYQADVVVLVAVRSPCDYGCVVMPVKTAEKAAQINLDRGFRTPKRDGTKKKPGKVWCAVDPPSGERRKHDPLRDAERKILQEHKDAWGDVFF